MRRFLILFLLLFIKHTCFSQLFISPVLGYHKEGIKTDGFNTFFDSWNANYKVGIKKEFEQMGGMPFAGWEYGIDLIKMPENGNGFYFRSGLYTHRSVYKNDATIWNNYSNEMVVKFKDVKIPFDVGYTVKGMFTFFGAMDVNFRDVQLAYWQYYPDGSKSVGNEFDINGVYTATSPVLNLGGGLTFTYKRILIPIRYTTGFALFNIERIPITDYDANQFRISDFPRNFITYQNDPSGTNQENVIYKDELRGASISVGIRYLISTYKHEKN